MQLGNQRASGNVEDRRGMGMVGGGVGIGGIVIALVAYFLGFDPGAVLNMAEQASPPRETGTARTGAPEDEMGQFVSRILGSTEDVWGKAFQQSGGQYRPPTLVLYDGQVRSTCGVGQSAMGPFYCPGDQKLYIDLAFFRDLQTRFRAPGDLAQLRDCARGGPPCPEPHRSLPAGRRGTRSGFGRGCEQDVGADGTAGRLLRRRVGTPRGNDGSARFRRHRRGAQCRDGDRRRSRCRSRRKGASFPSRSPTARPNSASGGSSVDWTPATRRSATRSRQARSDPLPSAMPRDRRVRGKSCRRGSRAPSRGEIRLLPTRLLVLSWPSFSWPQSGGARPP